LRVLLLAGTLLLSGGCATMLLTGDLEPDRSAGQAGSLVRRVETALSEDGRFDASRINVSASNDVVTLGGAVASPAAQSMAVETASAVGGVSRIINRLGVDGG
jgi:hypothetical protein